MESQSSKQSIQKMMKQAMGKQPLRQTIDEVSLANWASSSEKDTRSNNMQLKSRLVFLHPHQKVYQLRNISVAYLVKELGAALPHQSGVHIPTPFPVYGCQR